MPAGDAAEGDPGAAAADAGVPGLALFCRQRRAAGSPIGRSAPPRDARAVAPGTARAWAALAHRPPFAPQAAVSYGDDAVTIRSRIHSDGGISTCRRGYEFLSTISSSSESTPMY